MKSRITCRQGWSLVDLVVVVACIGVLAGGLLPIVMKRERWVASTEECAAHLQLVIQGLNSRTTDLRTFPVAYAYGAAPTGVPWNIADQIAPNPANGYVHWSGILSADGYVTSEASYQCPDVPRGGASNANPGPVAANWEAWQTNDLGGGVGTAIPNDRQAKRLAYTANAAIMPRNRFGATGPRVAQIVTPATTVIPAGVSAGRPAGTDLALPHSITQPSNAIAFTEFVVRSDNSWTALSINGISKSHRPVTPFLGRTAGIDVFNEPSTVGSIPRFRYPTQQEIYVSLGQVPEGAIADPNTELNAVGRHHTGNAANFAFLDGHLETMTVQNSVLQRKWGDKFYSISGDNRIDTN